MLRSSPKREMCCPVQTSVSVRNLCQIRSVVSEEDRETNGIFNIPNYHVGDKNSTLRHDLDVVHQRRCDTNQPGPNSSPPTLRRHHRLRGTEKKKFSERAFCVAGPSTWNSLPESLRRNDCTQTFKRRLKTHFLTSTSGLLCFNFSLFY